MGLQSNILVLFSIVAEPEFLHELWKVGDNLMDHTDEQGLCKSDALLWYVLPLFCICTWKGQVCCFKAVPVYALGDQHGFQRAKVHCFLTWLQMVGGWSEGSLLAHWGQSPLLDRVAVTDEGKLCKQLSTLKHCVTEYCTSSPGWLSFTCFCKA